MDDIPEDFWPQFVNRLRELAAIYNPVTLPRIYPFIVSRLPAQMSEKVILSAASRGLIAVNVVEFNRGHGEPEKVRVIELINDGRASH